MSWGISTAGLTLLLAGCGRIGYDGAPGEGDAMVVASACDTDAAAGGPTGPPGLIAHFPFDDSVTEDASGSGHHAVCVDGCPALEPQGYAGAALSMDGGASHLRVDDDGSFATPEFTVAGWVRYEVLDARTCIFAKPYGVNRDNSWALCTEADGVPFFFSCRPCLSLLASAPIEVGVWVHLSGTFDGGTRRLYVNGEEEAADDGAIVFDGSALVIGGDVDLGSFDFAPEATIDEIRVYDRALDPAEVRCLAEGV